MISFDDACRVWKIREFSGLLDNCTLEKGKIPKVPTGLPPILRAKVPVSFGRESVWLPVILSERYISFFLSSSSSNFFNRIIFCLLYPDFFAVHRERGASDARRVSFVRETARETRSPRASISTALIADGEKTIGRKESGGSGGREINNRAIPRMKIVRRSSRDFISLPLGKTFHSLDSESFAHGFMIRL